MTLSKYEAKVSVTRGILTICCAQGIIVILLVFLWTVHNYFMVLALGAQSLLMILGSASIIRGLKGLKGR